MSLVSATIITVLIIFVLNFVFERYYKQKQSRREELMARLEVLKIVAKHECFGRYQADPTKFQGWVAKFLELKGYSEIKFDTGNFGPGSEEQGLVALDLNGQNAYIACKLVNPGDWEKDIAKEDIQNMVGAMIALDVQRGLIVTTGELSPEAKGYLAIVQERGYFIRYIDGDALEDELYVLREETLPGLQETITAN